MKSIIGRFRVQIDSFPKSLTIANEEITDKNSISKKFNRFFLNTGIKHHINTKIPKYHIAQPIFSYIFQLSLSFFQLFNRRKVQKCSFSLKKMYLICM